ncbi:MAG TPA: RNA-binding cell elongation regulator Jag/EloR [Clostridia bacterium]
MKSVEVQEKTVELAIEKGLQQLGCTLDKVETEVLSAGGLFSKAKVRLTMKDTVGEKAQKFVEGLFKILKLGALVETTENDDEATLNIVGTDLSFLYNNSGEVFDSLQYLTALVANKGNEEYKRVVLESEDFRSEREQQLQDLAVEMAEKAVKTNKKVKLEPMNPYKRRIIHTKLQDDPNVTTHSEGVEPYRCVVIVPKNLKPSFERKARNNFNNKRRNDKNRKSYANGNNRNSKNYQKQNNNRSGSNGFAKSQKMSGFSTGTLIKRNSFETE